MIRSMTGYGRGHEQIGAWDITAEIKSVNHRYFEFSCRAPRSCAYMEDKLKGLVQKRISRGKTDLYLQIAFAEGEAAGAVRADAALAKSYMEALNQLSAATGLPNEVSLVTLAKMPDVLTIERADIDEGAFYAAVAKVLGEALDSFVAMREIEGAKMREDILSHLDTIDSLTAEVQEQSPATVASYRQRLYHKIKETVADRNIDETRVLTEAAIFADKVAVDEETVRLKSHTAQFREILNSPEPIGRKLDFLTQELNREANTIGSKAQDVKVAQVVIRLKSELEKIREQIQNIE